MKKAIISAICLFTAAFASNSSALNVTTNNDGTQLVNTILGPDITIEQGSIVYTGADNASGIFSEGANSGITVDKGIILTTGDASLAPGPNNSASSGVGNGLPGDADLDNLGFTTQDATSLKFNFTSQGGDLSFKYVFASEEYNEFANQQFNDVFAFFLDGKNIALLPGTTTPVSINSVNRDQNPQFFVDNEAATNNIQYDGFTQVLTAAAQALTPGVHTIKLAIADVGDDIFDSAVMIEGGSFAGVIEPTTPTTPTTPTIIPQIPSTTTAEPIPEPSTFLLFGAGLFGVGMLRRVGRR